MEWIVTSPRLKSGSADSIFCNGTSLSDQISPGKSLCYCKSATLQLGECNLALNYTQQIGATLDCGQGCPRGQRVYHTGASWTCAAANDTDVDILEDFDDFNDYLVLYETACQGY